MINPTVIEDPDGILVRFDTSSGGQVRLVFHRYSGEVLMSLRPRKDGPWTGMRTVPHPRRFGNQPGTREAALAYAERFRP